MIQNKTVTQFWARKCDLASDCDRTGMKTEDVKIIELIRCVHNPKVIIFSLDRPFLNQSEQALIISFSISVDELTEWIADYSKRFLSKKEI